MKMCTHIYSLVFQYTNAKTCVVFRELHPLEVLLFEKYVVDKKVKKYDKCCCTKDTATSQLLVCEIGPNDHASTRAIQSSSIIT